ncbi:MAG: HEAT repeat domain-containing protein [Kofleriaceae bacterium]|nr:HEAT repeat domain-containing protein [Kofleriaceae bacterium]
MKNIGTKLAAVAFTLLAASSPALAGKGGSAARIQAAVTSGSVDAIIAEVERAESLMCEQCVGIVTNLLEDSRYEVREVAGWWFAKRPGLKNALAAQFVAELENGNTTAVRNAADFLGATVSYKALPALRAAIRRTDIGAEGKLALVRAAKMLAHRDGNPVLMTAMTDADPSVRAAAVNAWRDILGQKDAAPAVSLLNDADAHVRAEAATVVGAMGGTAGVATLEQLVVKDPDPFVRRNAAWALGKIGSSSSKAALTTASTDKSGVVRGVARAALASIK